MSENKKYRLVTRSDFDGLVCAVLLRHLDLIDEIKFVHPKDVQDGNVELGPNDITTNLPYSPKVHLAFDHHVSETIRLGERPENLIIDPNAPSAMRVVFDHYGGFERFPQKWEEMLAAVDKSDSAQFTREEILRPTGWVMLSFIMDSRTGLGRFKEFRISNYNLMMDLIDYCAKHTINEILALPDVKERIDFYLDHTEAFRIQVLESVETHGDLVVIDLRDSDVVFTGNRFLIYALFPDCRLSIHVMWGRERQNVVFAVGKSILNRGAPINIGELMLNYDGGGHANAGTCQVPVERANQVKAELVSALSAGA